MCYERDLACTNRMLELHFRLYLIALICRPLWPDWHRNSVCIQWGCFHSVGHTRFTVQRWHLISKFRNLCKWLWLQNGVNHRIRVHYTRYKWHDHSTRSTVDHDADWIIDAEITDNCHWWTEFKHHRLQYLTNISKKSKRPNWLRHIRIFESWFLDLKKHFPF